MATHEGLAEFALIQSYLSTAAKWGITKLDALRGLFSGHTWLSPGLEPTGQGSNTEAQSHHAAAGPHLGCRLIQRRPAVCHLPCRSPRQAPASPASDRV